MELSVKVLGLMGGVDLTIRIELRLDRRGGISHVEELKSTDYFSVQDVRDWAEANGHDPSQAEYAFNALYCASAAPGSPIRVRCSRARCTARACNGLHEIVKQDVAAVKPHHLKVKSVGHRGQRLDILMAYREYLAGR